MSRLSDALRAFWGVLRGHTVVANASVYGGVLVIGQNARVLDSNFVGARIQNTPPQWWVQAPPDHHCHIRVFRYDGWDNFVTGLPEDS